MSDGKPSHAYWNGIGKIFNENEAATPFKPRRTLLSYSATPWSLRKHAKLLSCIQQLISSCRSSPSIQDEPSAASALSPNENWPLLGMRWNVTPRLHQNILRQQATERRGLRG